GSTGTRKAASRVRGSVEGLAYSSVLDGDRSCCRRRGDPHGRHRCPTRGAHAQPRIVGQPALAGTAVHLEEFARLTAPRTTPESRPPCVKKNTSSSAQPCTNVRRHSCCTDRRG